MELEFADREEVNIIVQALREAYSQKKSYKLIQIKDIVEHSKIPLGKIYAYFTDKDDILAELIKKDIFDIFITFDEEVDLNMDISDKLKAFISLQLEFIGQDLDLIKEAMPMAFVPFSHFSNLINDSKNKYLDFLGELFLNKINKNNFLTKNITVPALSNSFLLFNISVLQYWQNDKSEGRENTLNFIEKGIKNFMLMSAIL